MTPKEKAIELRFTYWKNADLNPEQAKQCAILAVNEILESIDFSSMLDGVDEYNYWLQIEEELEKL
jgi:hypothetical protein